MHEIFLIAPILILQRNAGCKKKITQFYAHPFKVECISIMLPETEATNQTWKKYTHNKKKKNSIKTQLKAAIFSSVREFLNTKILKYLK